MNTKDWTGNSRTAHAIIGARNYATEEREENDYYATEPLATEFLLQLETFSPYIWECACGGGHISEVLKQHGYFVYSSDLVNRGYGVEHDFLSNSPPPPLTIMILSRIPHIQKLWNLSIRRWILSQRAIKSLCSLKCNSLRVKRGGKTCTKTDRLKRYMYQVRVCIVL